MDGIAKDQFDVPVTRSVFCLVVEHSGLWETSGREKQVSIVNSVDAATAGRRLQDRSTVLLIGHSDEKGKASALAGHEGSVRSLKQAGGHRSLLQASAAQVEYQVNQLADSAESSLAQSRITQASTSGQFTTALQNAGIPVTSTALNSISTGVGPTPFLVPSPSPPPPLNNDDGIGLISMILLIIFLMKRTSAPVMPTPTAPATTANPIDNEVYAGGAVMASPTSPYAQRTINGYPDPAAMGYVVMSPAQQQGLEALAKLGQAGSIVAPAGYPVGLPSALQSATPAVRAGQLQPIPGHNRTSGPPLMGGPSFRGPPSVASGQSIPAQGGAASGGSRHMMGRTAQPGPHLPMPPVQSAAPY
eukprot:gene20208-26953_t